MDTIPFVIALSWPTKGVGCEPDPSGDLLVAAGDPDDLKEQVLGPHIALFKALADTKPTPEGIVRFASQYGWLSGPAFHEVDPGSSETASDNHPGEPRRSGNPNSLLYRRTSSAFPFRDGTFVYGERLDAWKQEIDRLNDLISLWEFVKAGKSQPLKSRIKWDGRNSFHYHDGTLVASKQRDPWLFGKLRIGSYVEAARTHLVREIDRSLAPIQPSLTFQKDEPRMKYILRYVSTAAWYQFARAVEGNLDHKECVQCGKWFETKMVRSDMKYCGQTCRVAAYRRNKREREAKE